MGQTIGSGNPTSKSFSSLKLAIDNLEYALLSANRPKSTAVQCITYQQKLTVILLDKCPRRPTVHQQRHMLSGKNTLERDFQISRHHLIIFIENVCIKRQVMQISILNLNMPKSTWDDADEPTTNNFIKIGNRQFWILVCSFKCESTNIDRSTVSHQQKLTVLHVLGDKCHQGTGVHQQQGRSLRGGGDVYKIERDFQISKHYLISRREN